MYRYSYILQGGMNMFVYCKKCGLIKNTKTQSAICPACEIPLEAVPKEYLSATGLMFASQSSRTEFQQVIKSSPEYDETANAESQEIIAQKEAIHKKEIEQKVEEYKNSRPQKNCPICHSSSISKISNVGKVVKVGAFGILGAGDLGKTWKCNSCGCKF